MKKSILISALLPVTAAALFLGGKPAAAQVQINFQNPVQSGTDGSTFQFFGTITNYGADPVFISGDQKPSPLPAGLTIDDSPSNNTPFELLGYNQGLYSYTGELFDVSVAPGSSPLSYSGDFTLTGGADPIANDGDTLTSQRFGVITTAAVPEASTTVSFTLLLCLGAAGAVVRKKKAAAA